MYVCTCPYQDKPVVKITAATEGCGYVYVSWTVIGNNDICEITNFHATLVLIVMGLPMGITKQISTEMNSYNFTGLSDDTLFDVTIIGSSRVVNADPASTLVRTPKSMYVCMYIIHT